MSEYCLRISHFAAFSNLSLKIYRKGYGAAVCGCAKKAGSNPNCCVVFFDLTRPPETNDAPANDGDLEGAKASFLLVVEEKSFCADALQQAIDNDPQLRRSELASGLAPALQILRSRPVKALVVGLQTLDRAFDQVRQLIVLARPAPALVLDDRPVLAAQAQAKAVGAAGYVAKTETSENILAALHAICRGETYFGAAIASEPQTALVRLSSRRLEVLEHLAHGCSNKEIAKRLGITPGTVKLHVHAILKATGARNRTEAALQADRLLRARRAPEPALAKSSSPSPPATA